MDDFTARTRDLQEGTPGVPPDDVDYMAAKVHSVTSVSQGIRVKYFPTTSVAAEAMSAAAQFHRG